MYNKSESRCVMQVNSVKLNDRISNSSFGSTNFQERFAALNDEDLKKVAYAKTLHNVNDKKHKLINNALIASIPIVGGIAAAVNPKSMSRLGRVGAFGMGMMGWVLPFFAWDVVLGAGKVASKIDSVKEFTQKHPMTTMLGTFAAAIGAYTALRTGSLKAMEKYGDKILEKAAPTLKKVSKALNASKTLDKASQILQKTPSALKEFSKVALNFAPWAIIFTSFAHSFDYESTRNKVFNKNYNELKAAQDIVRQDLASQKEAEEV